MTENKKKLFRVKWKEFYHKWDTYEFIIEADELTSDDDLLEIAQNLENPIPISSELAYQEPQDEEVEEL